MTDRPDLLGRSVWTAMPSPFHRQPKTHAPSESVPLTAVLAEMIRIIPFTRWLGAQAKSKEDPPAVKMPAVWLAVYLVDPLGVVTVMENERYGLYLMLESGLLVDLPDWLPHRDARADGPHLTARHLHDLLIVKLGTAGDGQGGRVEI